MINRQHQIEAAVILFAAMLYLTGSFWKAILVGMSVLVTCFVGIGPRGSFAVAIAAIAVVLGVPSPEHWVQLRRAAPHSSPISPPGKPANRSRLRPSLNTAPSYRWRGANTPFS